MSVTSNCLLPDDSSSVPSEFEPCERVEVHGTEAPVDESNLLAAVDASGGRERVRVLWFRFSARLADCSLAARFPGIEVLHVQSPSTKSLKGVERCSRLEKIVLDTGKRSAVDLTVLPATRVRSMSIHGATRKQLALVAHSSVEELELVGADSVAAQDLKGGAIKELRLVRSNIVELGELGGLGLQRLHVAECRRLRGGGGCSDTVESLIVESCKEFVPGSLESARGLRFLMLVDLKETVCLSELFALPHLSELSVTNCNVSIGTAKSLVSRSLRKVWISPFPNDELLNLSRSVEGVCFQNGQLVVQDGRPISSSPRM